MLLVVAEPLTPLADEAPEGDLPSAEEEAYFEEVDALIWYFRRVADPGADLVCTLDRAVSAFANRKSKFALDPEGRANLVTAVCMAHGAIEQRNIIPRLRYLRRGFAAVAFQVEQWAGDDRANRSPERLDHDAYFRAFRNEVQTARLMSFVRERKVDRTVFTLRAMAKIDKGGSRRLNADVSQINEASNRVVRPPAGSASRGHYFDRDKLKHAITRTKE